MSRAFHDSMQSDELNGPGYKRSQMAHHSGEGKLEPVESRLGQLATQCLHLEERNLHEELVEARIQCLALTRLCFDAPESLEVTAAYCCLGQAYLLAGLPEQALHHSTCAKKRLLRHKQMKQGASGAAASPHSTQLQLDIFSTIGAAQLKLKDFDAAEATLKQAAHLCATLNGKSDVSNVALLRMQAQVHLHRNNFSSAIDVLTRVWEIMEASVGMSHASLLPVYMDLARAYYGAKDDTNTQQNASQAIAVAQANGKAYSLACAEACSMMAASLRRAGQASASLAYWQQALDIYQHRHRPSSPISIGTQSSPSSPVSTISSHSSASSSMGLAAGSTNIKRLMQTLREIATVCVEVGEYVRAADYVQRMLGLQEATAWRKSSAAHQLSMAKTQKRLGQVLLLCNRQQVALSSFRKSFPVYQRHYGASHEYTLALESRILDLQSQLAHTSRSASPASRQPVTSSSVSLQGARTPANKSKPPAWQKIWGTQSEISTTSSPNVELAPVLPDIADIPALQQHYLSSTLRVASQYDAPPDSVWDPEHLAALGITLPSSAPSEPASSVIPVQQPEMSSPGVHSARVPSNESNESGADDRHTVGSFGSTQSLYSMSSLPATRPSKSFVPTLVPPLPLEESNNDPYSVDPLVHGDSQASPLPARQVRQAIQYQGFDFPVAHARNDSSVFELPAGPCLPRREARRTPPEGTLDAAASLLVQTDSGEHASYEDEAFEAEPDEAPSTAPDSSRRKSLEWSY